MQDTEHLSYGVVAVMTLFQASQSAKHAAALAIEVERLKNQNKTLQSQVVSSQALIEQAKNHSGDQAALDEALRKLKEKDTEIERLEDMVHKECLERTELLARLRQFDSSY